MKNIFYTLTLLLATTLAFSCANTTNKALKTGDVLKSSIEDFEKNRQKLSTSVVESLDEAQTALTQENPNMPEIAKDYEKEWKSVQNRYDKMRNGFEKIGTSSEAYFNQLNDLSSNINNEALRSEELAKNAELRRKWQTTYDEASVSVAKVTEVLESGNDFHMVLVASSIRMKLEKNVEELGNIAVQAKALLKDLEVFTEEGRKLVEG